MLKKILALFLTLLLSGLLISCAAKNKPTKEDQCIGLVRKITYCKNNASYDPDVIRLRVATLQQRYRAMDCDEVLLSK